MKLPTRNDLRTPDSLERVMRDVYEKIQAIKDAKPAAKEAEPTTPPITVVRNSLQSTGSAPLNVQGLPGRLAQPQYAYIPEVDTLPEWYSPISQDSGLVRYQGSIWVFSNESDPGSWAELRSLAVIKNDTYANRPTVTTADNGYLYYATDQNVVYIVEAGAWVWLAGVMEGTIAPDERPALDAADVGFLFYGTDTLLLYRWDGTGWDQFPPDASVTQSGIVNTTAQEFNGVKTFDDGIVVDVDMVMSSTSVIYIGAAATNGTWQIVRSGDDLQINRREAGTYVTKATVIA